MPHGSFNFIGTDFNLLFRPLIADELLAAGKGTALLHSVLIKALSLEGKNRVAFRSYSQPQIIIKGLPLATQPLF